MSNWKAQKLTELWQVDKAIRSEQEAKKEAMKEFNENIKGLEATRDQLLDKLAGGGEQQSFDDEPTEPEIPAEEGEIIDAEYDDDGLNAPDPGTYLGDDDE